MENVQRKSSVAIVRGMFFAVLPAQILSVATSYLGNLINGLVIGNCLPPLAMVALGFVSPLPMVYSSLATVISGGTRVLTIRL